MNEGASFHNRRLSRRRLPKGRVRATCRRGALDLGPDLALALLDLSETGARLAVKEPLPLGGEVSVALEAQSQPRPTVRVANVMWCAPAREGGCLLGVRFQKAIAYRDLLELSREGSSAGPATGLPVAPPAAERGRRDRRAGERLFHCRLTVAEGQPDLPALVIDLSAAGAGLLVPRELGAGAAVVLRVAEAGRGRPALDLPARAAYADVVSPGCFAVGADFLPPLGEKELGLMLSRMGRPFPDGK